MNTQTNFEAFVAGYLECAAWASGDGEENESYEAFEFAPSAELRAQAVCRAFIEACGPLIEQAAEVREWEYLGHDFWLTRCGHGTGFWDRDELKIEPCATVYGVARWDGPCYSSDYRGNELRHVLSAIASGTSRAIGRFEGADCYLGDDNMIYFG